MSKKVAYTPSEFCSKADVQAQDGRNSEVGSLSRLAGRTPVGQELAGRSWRIRDAFQQTKTSRLAPTALIFSLSKFQDLKMELFSFFQFLWLFRLSRVRDKHLLTLPRELSPNDATVLACESQNLQPFGPSSKLFFSSMTGV